MRIPLPSSVRRYKGEWFFVRNLEGSAPTFISWIPVAKPEWPYGTEKKLKPKIGYMLDAITKQRGRGLSDERLIHTFVQRRL